MFSPLVLKIAVQLIEQQLTPARTQQAAEPADISPEVYSQNKTTSQSVLSLLGKQNATATEPAPKVVTDTAGVTGKAFA